MNRRRFVLEILTVIIGNFIYAAGIVLFIMPSGLITGGTTGIALCIYHLTGLPVSYFVFSFNVIMFFLGLFILGKKFAFTTLISTFCYPIALEILRNAWGGYTLTGDILLCTVFGGICIGTSIALIIRVGSSTGGMDIPPLILYKFFRIPVSITLYIADCIILALQALLLKGMSENGEKVLYGILLVLTYTIIIDKLLMLGTSRMQIKVVSSKSEQVKAAIISEVDRGVTLIHGKTGYLENDTDIVLSVISGRELAKVEKLVHDIDEEAFVIISRVSEVRGRGFSLGKKYIK
ncbi:YitT family protein [Anaerocolumna chitinilytica]|uniref:Membrane protein n=1 Tax=Anaerocolumna chitinilytica TaxID=1727145 RepID=A0A7I8DM66_9FIRM|nr:YitT family protein [Anaerocolumna chitinilytica]BCJ99533.1 membrane protein [Anaerocolumna chitinilytica]